MAEVIDYGRFAERMRDVTSRWGLLREFQREWGYDEPGGEPVWPRGVEDNHRRYLRDFAAEHLGREDAYDRLAAVDTSLPVPEALDEWWDLPFNSFTHRPTLYYTNPVWPPELRPDPSGGEDASGLPEDNPFVGPDDDRRVCVFKTEYQDCNEWGYLAAEAGLPDPRVVVSTMDGWTLQSRSISEFFLQLAVERLPAHYGWTIRVYPNEFDDDPGIVERIRANYPELGLPPWRELGVDALSYGALDAIVAHARGWGADFPILVHARTREALLRVAWTLGVDVAADMIEAPADTPDDADVGIGPVALREGDADGRGRWSVLWTGLVEPGDASDGPGRPGVTVDAEGAVHWSTPEQAPRRAPFRPRGASVVASGTASFADGPAVAVAWSDGLIRVWDVRSGLFAELWPGTGITAVTLRPDASLLVTAGDTTTALRLDLDRLWPRRAFKLRLDEVDWASSRTLRGRPAAVADLIVRAASHRSQEAEKAVTALEEALYESGTACSAAAVAVPFLVEAAAGPDIRVRKRLFSLLSRIAWAAEDIDAGAPAMRWAERGRAAVAAAAPTLIDLLDHRDPDVRNGAASLLADLPDHRPDLLPVLQGRVADAPDVSTAASLVLAVGDLAADRNPPLEWLRGLLTDAESREVRTAAAVALLWCRVEEPSEDLIEVLVRESAAEESALDATMWTVEQNRIELIHDTVAPYRDGHIALVRRALREIAVRHSAVDWADALMRTWRSAPASLVPALVEAMDDPDETPRMRNVFTANALMEIARSGPVAAEVTGSLLPLLEGDDEVAGPALEALAGVGERRCLPVLAAHLAEPDQAPRYRVAHAIAGMAEHADALLEPLRAFLAECAEPERLDGDHLDRFDILEKVLTGVRTWGVRARPLLPELSALLHRGTAVSEVVATLGALGEAAADTAPALRARLAADTDDDETRANVAWALWRITGRAEDSLPVLEPDLGPEPSESTVRRLFDLGPAARPAVPYLEPLLDTDHSADAATCVLHRATGDPALIPRLVDAVAATPVGMLAVRCLADLDPATLDDPTAETVAAAVPRLTEIAESDEVVAQVPGDEHPEDVLITTDLAYRDLAALALTRLSDLPG